MPSNTVVIPAGEYSGKFKVQGVPTYLPADVDMFANFMIVSASEGEVAGFNNVFTLYMHRSCPFRLEDMVGKYQIKNSTMIDEKVIDLEIVLGSGADELIMLEPYAQGFDLTITVQQDITGNYTVIMKDQKVLIGRMGTMLVEMWGHAAGNWNTCTKVMKLVITPYEPGGVEYVPVTEIITKVD